MIARALANLAGLKRSFTLEEVLNSSLPQDVGCEITNVCNAKCSFCGYGKANAEVDADPRKKSKLSEDVLRHTADLFSKSGGGLFMLGPILGENSAHPRWLDYIKIIRSYPNITGVSCFTNAILLDRFGYDAIIQSGLTNLIISTYLGSAERYKDVYGVDKYDIVVTNILGLLEANHKAGSPVSVELAMRIDKPYERFYDSDLYKKITKFLKPKNIVVLEHGWDDYRGLISEEDLPIGHELKKNDQDKTKPCYAMYRKMQVMMNGDIQACACRVEPELWTDNIMNHSSMESAFKNSGLEKLRDDWWNGTIPECCQQCTHYEPVTNLVADKGRTTEMALKVIAKRLLKKSA